MPRLLPLLLVAAAFGGLGTLFPLSVERRAEMTVAHAHEHNNITTIDTSVPFDSIIYIHVSLSACPPYNMRGCAAYKG
jgi:hypothetical protein